VCVCLGELERAKVVKRDPGRATLPRCRSGDKVAPVVVAKRDLDQPKLGRAVLGLRSHMRQSAAARCVAKRFEPRTSGWTVQTGLNPGRAAYSTQPVDSNRSTLVMRPVGADVPE
jgi:hypothetical protein